MFWNYRVMREEHPWGDNEIDVTLVIVEAHYDEEVSKTIPTSYGDADLRTCSDDPEELKTTLERMSQALTRPILVMRDGRIEEWEQQQ